MPSLFESMARHRPEWLAQGLLMRAISTEAGVRQLILERLKWEQDPGSESVPSVTEEEVTPVGWRADLCVAWAQRKAYLELKLLAGFSERQLEALERHKIDLVVLLSRRKGSLLASVPIVTWAEVAEKTIESNLRFLLSQIGTSFDWRIEELPPDVLRDEFTGFMEGAREGRWSRMFHFLSTVHSYLREDALTKTAYRASSAWSFARKSVEPYYGYCFWIGEQDVPLFWMGFWRSQKTGEIVFGVTVPSKNGAHMLFEEPKRFGASDLASRVLTEASKYVQVGR